MSCQRGHVVFTVKLCWGIMRNGSFWDKLSHINKEVNKTIDEIWKQWMKEYKA